MSKCNNVKTGIQLCLKRQQQEFKKGISKFWGVPDLPPNFNWPVDEKGRVLEYICQLNLEEVAEFDLDKRLPSKGMLYFFGDVAFALGDFEMDTAKEKLQNEASYRVVYYDGGIESLVNDKSMVPTQVTARYAPLRVEYTAFTDFNTYTMLRDDFDLSLLDSKHSVELEDDCVVCDNKLLGCPTHLEEEDFYNGAEGLVLLLQVDSFDDEDFELNFVDYGRLYFLIDEDDLREKMFDNVKAWIDCS